MDSETRTERRAWLSRRRRLWWGVAIALGIVGLAGIVFGVLAANSDDRQPAEKTLEARSIEQTPSAKLGADVVEMPDVVGSKLGEARLVLETAGFRVVLKPGSSNETSAQVTSQHPEPGTLARASSEVTLTTTLVASIPKKPTVAARGWVVVIDPGHQEHSDNGPEPIGPGSKVTKPRVTGGTTGVKTGIPEYEIVLQISMNLRKRLAQKGVKVIMTRTTNDVRLSNSQRAAVANKAKADLFVRVHGDGSPDSGRSGVSTLYPASSVWTKSTWQMSRRAAVLVQRATVGTTGAVDLGIVARRDIAGFNYATMPSLLIECGFLSNPVEDRLLASPHYQDKLAEGIARGVMTYLSEVDK